ncbi:MAG: peptidylprolyl isomerase [Myxococcota bacterium]
MIGLLAALGCPSRGAGSFGGPEAASAAAVAPTWFDVEPGKGVCISPVPDAGPMNADARASFQAALAAVRAADLELATAVLEAAGDHPGIRSLELVVALLNGTASAAPELVALADAHPNDACLAASAAIASAALGTGGDHLARARALAPDDGRIAFLSWYVGAEPGEAVLGTLDRALVAEPDQPAFLLAAGITRFDAGDPAGVPMIERAVEGGMTEGLGVLLYAYFTLHRRADYLRLASELGLLGDEGRVAGAEDPEAAFRAELGWPVGTTLNATFETTSGAFRCSLFPDEAPVTVATFVGLARGTRPWVDPRDHATRSTPLYDGTTFHRVIPGFMIQGGDPFGDGTGDPGFRFLDEIVPERRFDHAGVLAMANMGPNTNGSQFFVTDGPAAHLDGRHTVFGDCPPPADGVVAAIARVPTGPRDLPLEAVRLTRLTITAAP